MNAREQARFDAVQRVGTFGTNNATDFPIPIAPATSFVLDLFAKLNTPDTGLDRPDRQERAKPADRRRHGGQRRNFQGGPAQCPLPGTERDQSQRGRDRGR